MDPEFSPIPRPLGTIRSVQLLNLRRRVSSHSSQIKLMAVHGVLGENGVVRRRRAMPVPQPTARAYGVE